MSDRQPAESRAAAAGHIEALKRERAAYEQSGKTDRVKQVDAEIARLSGDLDPARSGRRAPRTEKA